MDSQKIIICTTFRDFKGNENDQVQRLFLESLESQKYKNFEVVITLFGEKEVENELKKFNLKTFFCYGNPGPFRYSLTQVVTNAINYAEKKYIENYIILWTTCDVIFSDNFLNSLIRNYKVNILGTSHPHRIYFSREDYKGGKYREEGLYSGFDLVYFDKKFLQNDKLFKSLKNYVYNDWGIFEHFLISLGEFACNKNVVNLYEEEKICKIENNRQLTNEPNQFLIDSHKKNSATFEKFLNDNNLSKNYFNLTYCHIKFKQVKRTFWHYFNFREDYVGFVFGQIRERILRIMPDFIRKAMAKLLT